MFRLAGVLVPAVAALAAAMPAHAAPLPQETVEAREHFFGAENVAPTGASAPTA